MVVYFPIYFPKNGNVENTARRVKRVNILLDSIIEKKDVEKNLYNIEKEILEDDKPNSWNVWNEDNMEKTLEVDFRKFGIAVTKQSGQVLSKITTFTFYATVDLLKEQKQKK